jgi:ClpP class serine protease
LLKPDAVAISVSSPGGSPAATEGLVAAIRERAEATNIPVWGFATDVAASGGMWLLAGASDECFALETSVVGSIGVVAPSFGAIGALSKLGLERRVMKAGAAKAGADPFTPLSDDERERIQSILDDLHSTFISAIKKSRGPKIERATAALLKKDASATDDDDEERKKLAALVPDLFSGRIFTGKQAARLGLVDGVGGLREVCRRKLGGGGGKAGEGGGEEVRVRFAECGERAATGGGFFGGGGGASSALLSGLPANAVDRVMDTLEERGAYARFGGVCL